VAEYYLASEIEGVGAFSAYFPGGSQDSHLDGVATFSPTFYEIGLLDWSVEAIGTFAPRYYINLQPQPVIWVSRPQTTDFVVYETNKEGPIGAARTFLETDGWVYQALKLGDKMIYYGQYSVMVGKYVVNVAPMISRRTVNTKGILGKNAVCADDPFEPKAHFFIDRALTFNVLKVDGSLEQRDYSHHFATLLPRTVLMYDSRYNCVRIADGIQGFTFTYPDGLGWGPPELTGCGVKGGTFYAVAPRKITAPPMSCKTDWLDFESREEKCVYELDFGTYVNSDIYAAVDYRWERNGKTHSSPWVKVDRQGRAFVDVCGVEFQIKWKLRAWADIRIDYIPVKIKYYDLKPVNA